MEFIPAKTIISGYTDKQDWFGTNYNMNIYKGCSHGCIYCDSRSDCYHVEHFDTVRGKAEALLIIERELKSKRQTGVIGTGAMSDPYNPMEARYELTRGALEIISRSGFGISIATKSDLIVRDIDLLMKIANFAPVLVMMTITTADDNLSKQLEPRVANASQRFGALRMLADAGIYTGILMMPILPMIEDTVENITAIMEKGIESGIRCVYPGFGVTLRGNQRQWYYEQLDRIFPGLKEKYIKTYGDAYSCSSPNGKILWNVVKEVSQGHQIDYRMKDIIEGYKKGYGNTQISLFD